MVDTPTPAGLPTPTGAQPNPPMAAAGQSLTGAAAAADTDVTISLAELAGLDMDDVEAKRFGAITPKGSYRFHIREAKLETLGKHNVAAYYCPIIHVHGVADPETDVEALLNYEHRELFFLKDVEAVGYLKQFMLDIGLQASGALARLLELSENLQFDARVEHTPDKNDTSRIYTRLVDIIPVQVQPQTSAPTQAPAQAGAVAG